MRRSVHSLFVAFFLLTASPASADDKLYAHLVERMSYWLSERWIGAGRAREGRKLAWGWASYAEAAIEAHKGTGERRYLDLVFSGCMVALATRDNVMGVTDEVRGVAAPSWASPVRTHPKDKTPRVRTAEITTTGLVFHACLRAVRESPGGHEAMSERVVSAALEAYTYHKTDCPERCLVPTTGEPEPLNHQSAYGAMLVHLFALTERPDIKADIERLSRFFLSCARRETNGSYVWEYRPDRCPPTGDFLTSPFYKAGISLMLPVAAHAEGIVFSDEDMRALARTFNRNVVRDRPRVCKRIGTGRCFTNEQDPYLNTAVMRWIVLEDYDPTVRQKLERLLSDRPDYFTNGWFTSQWSVLAYARGLGSNGPNHPH